MTESQHSVESRTDSETIVEIGIAQENSWGRQTVKGKNRGRDGADYLIPEENQYEAGTLVEIEFDEENSEFVRVEEFQPTETEEAFQAEFIETVQDIDGVGQKTAEGLGKLLPVFGVTEWSEIERDVLHQSTGTQRISRSIVRSVERLAEQEDNDEVERVNGPDSKDNFEVITNDGRLINAYNVVVFGKEFEVRESDGHDYEEHIFAIEDLEEINNISSTLVPKEEAEGFAEALTADEDRTAREGLSAAYDILKDEKQDLMGGVNS